MRTGDVFGLVGTTIADKFRVDRLLGEGGFGVVYGGMHLVLGVPVAIKCLKPVGTTDSQREHTAQAFLREARILFGLGHPSIVRLYDVGVIPQGQVPYAVLELLSGPTLQDEITTRAREKKAFSRDELTSLFLPIFEAVGYAHERGIIHRDLKPANLMLVTSERGTTPKVLDFGTARGGFGTGEVVAPSPSAASVLASSERTGFTPLYAAPEQWDASYGATGPATDVFSLGLTLLETCLLAYPFDVSDGLMAIWRAISDDRRPSVRASRPDLPAELDDVLRRALRVRAGERYPDARELCASFRTAMKASPETAPLAKPLAAPPASQLPDTMPVHGISLNAPPPRPIHVLVPTLGPPKPPHAQVTPAPAYGSPPPYAIPFGSTTQGQAFAHPTPPPAPRPSALPWVLGGGAIVIALGALAVAGIALFLRTSTASSPLPTDLPEVPTAAGTSPAPVIRTPTAATTAPVTRRPKPGAVAGPKRIAFDSAIGGSPCWTQAEIVTASRNHEPQLQKCVDASVKNDPTMSGDLSLIVHPTAAGKIDSVQCSFGDDQPEEGPLCGCVQSSMTAWKMPPSHGKLGALDAVNFIVEYKVRPGRP